MSGPDFRLLNCGTIILLTPCSPAATRWTQVNLPRHATRYGEVSIAVEPAFIGRVLDAIVSADLSVHGREVRT